LKAWTAAKATPIIGNAGCACARHERARIRRADSFDHLVAQTVTHAGILRDGSKIIRRRKAA
jgi:hypothetical protein